MESAPNIESVSVSSWDYLVLVFLRPLSALLFVLVILLIGWYMAWKLVLVHVPLVQEIFGLRLKPTKPKSPLRRFSNFYNSRHPPPSPPPQ